VLYNPNDTFCLEREPDDNQYTLDHYFIKILNIAKIMKTHSAKDEALTRTAYMYDC
ncbi:regulator, partial [Pseudoalteromonas sp. S4741]